MTPRPVVLVTGLSGAGKASILGALEDCGFETVDNPPLHLLDEVVTEGEGPLAVGVDARTRGFDAGAVLAALARLRANPALHAELLYAVADEAVLQRRYSETRRRHPLAPRGRVADGIAAEAEVTAPLKAAADLVIDTSDLPLRDLRARIEKRFRPDAERLAIAVTSFAYPRGVPREADLVFDCRWLTNPHDDPVLRPLTGLDDRVAARVKGDPDYAAFFSRLTGLVELLLPRFRGEGKKYLTIAVGCTGGRHRSVTVAQELAGHLGAGGWRVDVTHRELGRETTRPAHSPLQAQEA